MTDQKTERGLSAIVIVTAIALIIIAGAVLYKNIKVLNIPSSIPLVSEEEKQLQESAAQESTNTSKKSVK